MGLVRERHTIQNLIFDAKIKVTLVTAALVQPDCLILWSQLKVRVYTVVEGPEI